MSKLKLTAIALIAVLIASFTVLLSIGSDIYREKPPIPTAFVATNGQTLFSKDDVEQGQLVWRSMGGHQRGWLICWLVKSSASLAYSLHRVL